MADNLITDLIKRYRYEYSADGSVETNHPDLERLIVYENEHSKEVFVSKGKAVIHVRYYGHAEVDSVIESIIATVDLMLE